MRTVRPFTGPTADTRTREVRRTTRQPSRVRVLGGHPECRPWRNREYDVHHADPDDPSRGPASGPNQNDVNDPFGGNDGANQARRPAGSPVQVFAPGFRNPYDLVIASTGNHAGKMYVPDNGPNGGWGDTPVGEGTPNCTNQTVAQAETGASDALHLVTPGYYGGHANPTRQREQHVQRSIPGAVEQPGGVRLPARRRQARQHHLAVAELLGRHRRVHHGQLRRSDDRQPAHHEFYQARKVVRIVLDSAGSAVTLREDNFATFSTGRPLDVVTIGSGQAFPGTIRLETSPRTRSTCWSQTTSAAAGRHLHRRRRSDPRRGRRRLHQRRRDRQRDQPVLGRRQPEGLGQRRGLEPQRPGRRQRRRCPTPTTRSRSIARTGRRRGCRSPELRRTTDTQAGGLLDLGLHRADDQRHDELAEPVR